MKQIYRERDKYTVTSKRYFDELNNLVGLKCTQVYRGGGSLLHLHFGALHLESRLDLTHQSAIYKVGDYSIVLAGEWDLWNYQRKLIDSCEMGYLIDETIAITQLGNLVTLESDSQTFETKFSFQNGYAIRVIPTPDGFIGIHRFGQFALHRSREETEKFVLTPVEIRDKK